MREAALKIAALFSYCGGPLFIADLLKPRFKFGWVFLMTLLPVALMVFGAFCLDFDTRSRTSFAIVRAGRLGLYAVLGMNVYTVWCFMNGVRVPDQSLHYLGIVIGVAWSVAYLRAVRRWELRDSSHAGVRASIEPIEPS